MNLFNKLSRQAKKLYFKAKKYTRLLRAVTMIVLVVCMIQIGIFYLSHFSGILVESPTDIELLGMGAILTAITFPVTLIITSKIPIIRFRIYSNYRYGFNSVFRCLMVLLMLGLITKILPNFNTLALSLFIKEYIHPFNFLNHNRLWFQCILEIQITIGVIFILLRIIWLGNNPIKFRKSRSENIYREVRLLLQSNDEAVIALLISELSSNIKSIIKLAVAESDFKSKTHKNKWTTPAKYAYKLLVYLLGDGRDDNKLFLQVVLKKHPDFLYNLMSALKGEYAKDSAKVNPKIQQLILINPIKAAFELNELRHLDLVLLFITVMFSDKSNAFSMVFTALRRDCLLGFCSLLFKDTSPDDISATDYEKYILIVSRLFNASATLKNIELLYFDIDFLKKFFAVLYKKDDAALKIFVEVVIRNHKELIQLFRNIILALKDSEKFHDIESETENRITYVALVLQGMILSILGMLARASIWSTRNFSIVWFYEKLLDDLFINTSLKDHHFGEETKRDLICHLSDSICTYFLNTYKIPHKLLPQKENASFLEVMQVFLNNCYLPLSLFFQIYPLKRLEHIIDKKDTELSGSEIIATRVFYLISEQIIESTSDELQKTLQDLYFPRQIKHLQVDNKHYLLENINDIESKIELFYDFSRET